MKLPFLHKNNSSTSSSWPWPSCHQNPKTISFRATITFTNPIHENDLHYSPPPSSSIESSPEITESIENVIEGLKSSKRLIFQRKGDSNSILDQEQEHKQEQEQEKEEEEDEEEEEEEEEDLFMLMSMESTNPFSDFKRSMEEMVEAHALHHDFRSLEKLLYNFLKVNDKSSHGYIFAAFVDLLVNLALQTKENELKHGVLPSRAATSVAGEASTSSCERRSVGESPLSPLSFYTSCSSYSSSSDETSSTSVPFMALSSLLEMDQEKKKKKTTTSLDHSFVS